MYFATLYITFSLQRLDRRVDAASPCNFAARLMVWKRCVARTTADAWPGRKGFGPRGKRYTIYQTYLVLYTLMARYCNYDITWTNHVCTRRPAATANKDSETKGNRNETNERIQQVPGKRVPTFFGIFAPGFATSSASFSLLQGVLSCSEFLGMEHGAIRSAPWIKWVDWIVHHMNCESYGIKMFSDICYYNIQEKVYTFAF